MRRRRGSFARKLSAKEHWDLHYGPNMTPMVDVVMVILVFFMSSSSILGPEWLLKSALPVKRAAAAAPPGEQQQVLVSVSASMAGGVCVVNGAGLDKADLGSLQELLRSRAAESGAENVALLVTPDPDVPYLDLVRIHELCHALGITKIGLLEKPGTPGAPAPGPAPAEPR
ncbi:MAG: biopolymer transporter ExbD [Phycisphaerales bacterium]|nr:biopolymer transporter ExbD [Phycisphaerales bacterium]